MEFEFLKTVNILYIEDDDSVREGYVKTLQRCAKELFVATNGEDGLEQFEKYKDTIQLIVTDIKMPKLSGIDMVKKIQESSPNLPIIFTSAHSDSAYLFEALEIQADGYLLKPVPVKKLMALIDKISKNIYMEKLNKKQEKIIHQMEKMTAIGEMIGNIAHQWRQPLSVISTVASGLKLSCELQKPITDEQIISSLKHIIDETKILSNIISDFRVFFKGDLVVKTPFKIKDMCERLDYLQLKNYKDEVSLIREFDEELEIKGNENLLIQVFINIINNTLDILENTKYDKKLIFVNIHKEDEKTIIKIKDNAGGIPEKIINKVFEPYFTTKHQSQGTGLGLYVVYEIITRQFNGCITIENVDYTYDEVAYKGVEFTISI